MVERKLNIIDFVGHKDLLNDQSHSEAQVAVLNSIYGLRLTEKELAIYRAATGRDHYPAVEESEVTIIAGRRSGKTYKIAVPITIFEAFRDHGIPPGEEAFVMLIAPTMPQARIAFRRIRSCIRNSKVLSSCVVSMTKDEIRLDNGIVIACYACSYESVRGRTTVAIVCDEVAFWADGVDRSNPAEEVLTALRPSMACVRNPKLVKISTPFWKGGLLWREFQRRSENDFPVFQLPTEVMNPTVQASWLEQQKRRLGEEEFSREYLAQFTDTINSWVPAEMLDSCIIRGRKELPPLSDVLYVPALDPATRGDDFAFAVLHRSPDGMIVVDYLATWRGTPSAPVLFERVLPEIKGTLDYYGISSASGDQYCCDAISQALLRLGIEYEIIPFSSKTRRMIFSNLKHLIIQEKIELLDHAESLQQLRILREEKSDRGFVDIRPIGNMRDDLAVVIAWRQTN
jgi:hypothetical protein